jgi:hypothetical protein
MVPTRKPPTSDYTSIFHHFYVSSAFMVNSKQERDRQVTSEQSLGEHDIDVEARDSDTSQTYL